MTKEEQELLEQATRQLELVKQQDRLLEDIELHLHSMKRIAEYAARQSLSTAEVNRLNQKLRVHEESVKELKKELHNVQRQIDKW